MDETPLRVGPKTPRPGRKKADKYLLIACTRLYTHFLLGDRDLDTFKACVLADVAAGTIVVHDRYTLYDNKAFAGIVHQLCTQHLLRDLAGAGETYPEQIWPGQIADALRGLIHATNTARDNSDDQIDPDVRAELVKTLRHGVLAGLSATTSHGDRPGEAKARALLEVFRDRQEDILRFVDDLTVPPTSDGASHCTFSSRSAGFGWGDRLVRGLGLIMARATDSLHGADSGRCGRCWPRSGQGLTVARLAA